MLFTFYYLLDYKRCEFSNDLGPWKNISSGKSTWSYIINNVSAGGCAYKGRKLSHHHLNWRKTQTIMRLIIKGPTSPNWESIVLGTPD